MKKLELNLSRLKTSWTKFDIVQVLNVVSSVDNINKYLKGDVAINEPILKSFLGIRNLDDPIPSYWIDIQEYTDKEKKLFAMAALLFTHIDIIYLFSKSYSQGDMKGVAVITSQKSSTNLRSALVESGAAQAICRRKTEVPYDFTTLLTNRHIGPLFKKVLLQRFSVCGVESPNDEEFYNLCYENQFHAVLSLSEGQFYNWLEGVGFKNGNYVESLIVSNFLCINTKMEFNLNHSHEAYLLGENGDGKTVLLMAIYLAFNGYNVKNDMDPKYAASALSVLQKTENDSELIGIDDCSQNYSPKWNNTLKNIYAYGTHRGRCDSEKYERYGFMSLFNINMELINPEQWIRNLVMDETKYPSSVKIGKEALSKVINHILDRDVEIKVDGSKISFVEKGYEESFSELSEGYRTIIIFICDFLSRIIDNNPKNKDILNTKAVVLIDEIDEHLHLRWQRTIVKKMREIFPNVQFIMTTHSPTIIQGASDDAIIYRIYREDGITKISDPYYKKELNELMVNSLVTSPLFGLDNSRMDEKNAMSDTSDDFVLYRINKKVREELDTHKKNGDLFLNDQEIDEIINNVLKEKSYEKD